MEEPIKIIIAGDFSPRRRGEALIREAKYDLMFDEVKKIIETVDYSIVDFETTIVTEENTPCIKKTGPCLKCEEKSLESLKYAGFDCLALANNHFRDYGDVGVRNTIELCRKHGFDYVGGGENLESAQKILYKNIKGRTIAFINICENEWSIASAEQGGSAPLDAISNYYQIQEAKRNAECVVVITHGGIETYPYPTPRMKKTYRFLVDVGADIVVNHHQHVYSGFEIYKGKPIFYGLGNFYFDTSKENRVKWWEEGYLVELVIGKNIDFELIPYIECGDNPEVSIIHDNHSFIDDINCINTIISNDDLLKEKFEEYVAKKTSYYSSFFEYGKGLFGLLRKTHIMPSVLTKEKSKALLNIIRCESHNEILVDILKNKMK